MKYKLRQGVLKISHIYVTQYSGKMLISIGTHEKWPKVFTSSTFGPGNYKCENIYLKPQHNRGKSTIVELIPETRSEKRLFSNCVFLNAGNRYGPNYFVVPRPTS